MAKPDIYLVRHGETEWNAAGRYQGALDSPLTAHGRSQAHALGATLATLIGHQKAALHVSPLGRARETAALIQQQLPSLVRRAEARLREVSLGRWDGLTDIDIEAGWPGRLDGCTRWDWYFRAPDGETYDSALARAESWLADIHEPTIAVTHGLFSRFLRGVYLRWPAERFLALSNAQGCIWRLRDGRIDIL